MVVPGSKNIQVVLGLAARPDLPPRPQPFLQRSEEPFDAAVLPRSERRDSLMADAEDGKTEAKEQRSEDRLVVGAHTPGWPEALDRVEDRSSAAV